MAYHRFRIGQQVVPLADGIPYYRAKSLGDGHQRALSEHSLRPAPMPANINDAPPRRSKAAKAG